MAGSGGNDSCYSQFPTPLDPSTFYLIMLNLVLAIVAPSATKEAR